MPVPLPPILSFKPDAGCSVDSPPVVIVLQEWWGVNEQIKIHAQKIADITGAEAIIPDLYKGKIGLDAEEASHLMNVDEIEALCDSLRKDDANRKIAVLGFCMGGALTLASAALLENPLVAAVVFYGIPPEALCDVSYVLCKRNYEEYHLCVLTHYFI
jgi:carboxymethylenebutenolidase